MHVVQDGSSSPSAHTRPVLVPPSPPAPAAPAAPAGPHSAAARDALRRALDEGHVFVALTGLPGVGKTAVLDAVLAETTTLRVLRIQDPGSVSDRLAAQIEQVALTEASRTESDKHVLLVVDDAHLASVELLDALSRLAAVRRAGGRLPQLVLVGQPVLWDRLKAERFRPLERRLVIRPELASAPSHDAWASVEHALALVSNPPPAVARPAAGPPPSPATKSTPTPPSVPRAAALPAAATDLEPLSRIDSLLARRAELVPVAQERRRSPRPLILALLIMSIATVAVAAAVQLAHLQPSGAASDAPVAAAGPPPAISPAAAAAANDAPAISGPASPAEASQPLSSPAQPGIAPPPQYAGTTAGPAPAGDPAPAQAAVQPIAVVEATSVPPPSSPSPEPARAPISASPANAQPAPDQPAQAAAPPSMAPEVVALLLRRGEERLAIGDIVTARAFFERAGSAGNSRASFLAGRTYDRAFLPADAAGLANPVQATEWYRRGAAAGDAAAATRLQQLGASPR